jgi:hypothetical protein
MLFSDITCEIKNSLAVQVYLYFHMEGDSIFSETDYAEQPMNSIFSETDYAEQPMNSSSP